MSRRPDRRRACVGRTSRSRGVTSAIGASGGQSVHACLRYGPNWSGHRRPGPTGSARRTRPSRTTEPAGNVQRGTCPSATKRPQNRPRVSANRLRTDRGRPTATADRRRSPRTARNASRPRPVNRTILLRRSAGSVPRCTYPSRSSESIVFPAACLEIPRRRPSSTAVVPSAPIAWKTKPCIGRRSGMPSAGQLGNATHR